MCASQQTAQLSLRCRAPMQPLSWACLKHLSWRRQGPKGCGDATLGGDRACLRMYVAMSDSKDLAALNLLADLLLWTCQEHHRQQGLVPWQQSKECQGAFVGTRKWKWAFHLRLAAAAALPDVFLADPNCRNADSHVLTPAQSGERWGHVSVQSPLRALGADMRLRCLCEVAGRANREEIVVKIQAGA